MLIALILFIILLILIVVIVAAIAIGGAGAILVFGDVIVCIFIIIWIIKRMFR